MLQAKRWKPAAERPRSAREALPAAAALKEARIARIHHLQVLTAQQYYKIPLYSSNVLSIARTDRFTGYVVSDGQTVFNNETLKNLVQVTGE